MSENNAPAIVSRVWSLCDILRDDGVSYSDYLEQLTYLIFLKMAKEYSEPPYNQPLWIPTEYTWDKLAGTSGPELETQYKLTLDKLGKTKGLLGEIFAGAQNKISDPAKLSKIIRVIGSENWVSMSADVKGDIYEGLLEKNAEDTKSGAGQYFTPRPLIKAMVECIDPQPGKTIVDPACGTGGFFLSAYDHLSKNHELNRDQKKFLKTATFHGWEIVRTTYRLCLMNLFLHNIGDLSGSIPVTRNDSLLSDPGQRFDYVLTNPPFGTKSSVTITNDEGETAKQELTYNRQDFWTSTSNKQFNFVQHIKTLLKSTGKAAVVVPDNVLFEGGAGETIRKKLLETCDLHTILRLPTGIFYKQGVKANVIFFDNATAGPGLKTKDIWIYDFRTNIHFTLKKKPMKFEDLEDFIRCYNPENRHLRTETWSETNQEGRFKRYSVEDILKRDGTSMDIFWLKDDATINPDELPDPDELAAEILAGLEDATGCFRDLVEKLR